MDQTALNLKRQEFQLHRDGYKAVVDALKKVSQPVIDIKNVEVDLTETNSLLYEVLEKMNEPICVKLKLS